MSDRQFHPDYLKAPPEIRWNAPLNRLRWVLEKQWEHRPGNYEPGAFHWRVLPDGAWVGITRLDDSWHIRFRRRDPFKTEDGPTLWLREVATFRKHMQLESWTPAECPDYRGPCSTFREPPVLGV